MNKANILLYFDVVSPYTWIAFESLLRYEKTLGVSLKLIPAGLGFIMRDAGSSPPALVEKKGQHNFRDLKIVGKYWGIPMNPPSNANDLMLNKGSLKAQRFLTAIHMKYPNLLVPAAREFWMRLFSRGQTIHELEDVKQVCEKLNIGNSDDLIKLSNSDEIKSRFKTFTDEAINKGAFGMPWIVVEREGKPDICFFGSDRLPVICDLLECQFSGPMKDVTNVFPMKSKI
uniref:Glutathione S-transferase kappa n=1 Tax=Ditylenchus dipsaci TaxID=166011 RepID=A0A915DUA1_9BILA